jgi:pimeloyl-ACP methyl ester carboxylesterase
VTPPQRRTTPSGLEVWVTGSGTPVTVFAHGLVGSVAETRPFGGGVRGTRVFFHFRGYGESPPPPPHWSYEDLAADLAEVADATGASRAVGVSLGAGAILRLLAEQPRRFERLVLVLPAGLDQPRPATVSRLLRQAADAAEAGDRAGLTNAVLAMQPSTVRARPEVVAWAERRARQLAGTPVTQAMRAFADVSPLADRRLDRRVLAACHAPALVLGHEGDDAHPVGVAEEVAAALPRGEVEVYAGGGLLWDHRAAVRERVSTFLNSPDPGTVATPVGRGG